MAWSNPTGTYNADPMDSSDGTSAQTLIVRNAAATPSGAYRAQIIETGGTQLALKVNGKLDLTKDNGGTEQRCGRIEGVVDEGGAKSLHINTGMNDPDVHIGNEGQLEENRPALVVRTRFDLPQEQYRVEVRDPGGYHKALHVKGSTKLEAVQAIDPALGINGKTTMDLMSGQTDPLILQATGRTKLIEPSNTQPGQELTLWVYGRTDLHKINESQTSPVLSAMGPVGIGPEYESDSDATMLTVVGKSQLIGEVRIEKLVSGNPVYAGTIRPEVVNNQGELQFNAEAGDPDMVMGHSTNQLTINSEVVLNGPITSSALVEGLLTVGTPEASANATIYGATESRGNLSVGTTQQPANAIINGTTDSKGALTVGTPQAAANATVYGSSVLRGAVTVGTAQTPANANITGDLDVNGNADINGNTVIHGVVGIDEDTTIQGNASIHGFLIAEGTTESRGNLTVGTAQQNASATVNGTSALKGTVTVGTPQANANASINGNLTAKDASLTSLTCKGAVVVGSALVPTTATLHADVDIKKKLEVADLATLKGGIDFNDSGTIYSVRVQNDRFEFLIGGTLRFYVDTTGGHNG